MIALLLLAIVGSNDPPADAPVVSGAIPLEETGRYRSPRSFDETIDFYERQFKRVSGLRWHNVVSLPGVKAKNIECLRKKTNWEGINVYENNGEVRIYVIPRDRRPKNKVKPPDTNQQPTKKG